MIPEGVLCHLTDHVGHILVPMRPEVSQWPYEQRDHEYGVWIQYAPGVWCYQTNKAVLP